MNLIYFILVLGITVFIHELGHYIFAKRAGIYVYDFSLGMGPLIYQFRRKNDETTYGIRLFPIGGAVQLAGEEVEADEKIPKEKRLQSKSWLDRFLTVIAGVMFNFLLAIILLFVIGLINGVPTSKPIIAGVDENYMAHNTNLKEDDLIISINGRKVSNIDLFLLELQINSGKNIDLKVKHENGSLETITLEPKKEEVDGKTQYKYGFYLENNIKKGFIDSIGFAFSKTISLIEQMFFILYYLFIGKLSLSSLSGPIGIYNVVGETAKAGILSLIYLISFLCINVGFINLLPIPAFDGGRLLFLIIEKIKGSPVNQRIENTIHAVGFALLMILMIVITYNDILKFIL